MRRHFDIVRRIVLAALAAVGIGSFGLTGVSAASPAPSWQVVPDGGPDMGDLVPAASRVWLVNVARKQGHADLRSAPVTKGRMGTWKTTSSGMADGWIYEGLLGDELVFASSDDPSAALYAIKLLPNGNAGRPIQLGGAPPTATGSPGMTPSDVVQLPDRAVRIVGVPNRRHELTLDPGACCSADGKVVNYASFVSGRGRVDLGLDRHGRIWLGWSPLDPARGSKARLVEVDPKTLEPRGAVETLPGLDSARIDAMVCGSTCRLLVEGWPTGGRGVALLSWAHGERSPTELRLPSTTATSPLFLIGAHDDANRLVVAYWTRGSSEVPMTVGLARGDVRGGGLHVVGSVPAPAQSGTRSDPVYLEGYPTGGLGPDGLAAGALMNGGAPPRYSLRVMYVPLR